MLITLTQDYVLNTDYLIDATYTPANGDKTSKLILALSGQKPKHLSGTDATEAMERLRNYVRSTSHQTPKHGSAPGARREKQASRAFSADADQKHFRVARDPSKNRET